MKGIAISTTIIMLLAGISISLASGASVRVDLNKLGHGMMGINVPGGPYYIIRRSDEEQKILINKYGEENLRSGHNNFILIKAVSPDSECALLHVVKGSKEYEHHPISSTGGFLDLCSCAWFDLTGRRQSKNCHGKDVEIAPHRFLYDEVVIVGGE
ncbi:MAG: hypothetical protein ABW088_14185 [Sedimenticola sp.]